MRREILFRGLRADGKGWAYGDLVQWKTRCKCAILPQEGDEWANPFDFEVRPETVGQFTGLHDKNGMRIFEGDVTTFGVIVVYDRCRFCLKNERTQSYFDFNHPTKVIITGNIHEQ